MTKHITKPNNINSFTCLMNELQSEHPDINISGKWHLHLKEGLLRFAYSRELPKGLQLKCVAIFIDALGNSTCVIGSFN